MRRILLALLLVALAVSTADARRRHHWFYGSALRGVEALEPADWQLQPSDPLWPGRRFLSPDGNAWMALYSVSADKEPREEHVKKVAFGEGEELTYLRREPDWLVASGLK